MTRTSQLKNQSGMMLIEALIGILIFSIGILALIAMQATAITNTTESRYRTEASFLANQIIGQIWVDRGTNNANIDAYDTTTGAGTTALTAWTTKVAATLPGVTVGGTNSPTIAVTTVGGARQVVVTVFWKRPDTSAPTRNFTAIAQIAGNN